MARRNRLSRRLAELRQGLSAVFAGAGESEAVLEAQRGAEDSHRSHPVRHERIGQHIGHIVAQCSPAGKRVLEIGGRANPHKGVFPGWDYANLDLQDTGPGIIRGDITHIPEIADGSFDVILSVDVFEHIDRPWEAAREIARLLAPGGCTYHSTLFSWRYHPCPIDYWRFTPDALRFLFSELECIDADFDDTERRRDIIGRGKNKLTADAFGGWRENWRVFFAGRKPRA